MALSSSLIVPFFNESRYLKPFLNSVCRQTLPFNQIILCNNNSNDKSLVVIKPYHQKLPLTVVFQPKMGTIPSLNLALKYATGDLILRTDADCLLPPSWHQHMQQYFSNHPQSAACTGPWLASDGNLFHRAVLSICGSLGAACIPILRGYPLLQGCNTAIRRQALDAVHQYHSQIPATDDQLITNKLHRAGYSLGWSWSSYLYTSTRRYQHHPQEYFYGLLSFFYPKHYHLKSS